MRGPSARTEVGRCAPSCVRTRISIRTLAPSRPLPPVDLVFARRRPQSSGAAAGQFPIKRKPGTHAECCTGVALGNAGRTGTCFAFGKRYCVDAHRGPEHRLHRLGGGAYHVARWQVESGFRVIAMAHKESRALALNIQLPAGRLCPADVSLGPSEAAHPRAVAVCPGGYRAAEGIDYQSRCKCDGAIVQPVPPFPDKWPPPLLTPRLDLRTLAVDGKASAPSPQRVCYFPRLRPRLYGLTAVLSPPPHRVDRRDQVSRRLARMGPRPPRSCCRSIALPLLILRLTVSAITR